MADNPKEISGPDSMLMPTYARQPIAFVRGKGSWLYTEDDTAYLDALTGIAVCGLGHAHPVIAEEIGKQAAILMHTSNIYIIPWQEKAGKRLCEVAGMQQVFFCNSGAEANEAAIKLARMYGFKKGYQKPKIIVMERSFHGRTLATLSATGNEKVQKGFYPLQEDFIRVPFGDVDAIKKLLNTASEIVAILVEPIQGEGGINTAENGFNYIDDLRAICDDNDWLLMLDEIQTGNGRTGKYFAYQYSQSVPDVLTTAKGLGNGFPVGACMVSGKAVGLFGPGNHGSTYGGTPLACHTVYTVIETIINEKAMEQATKTGSWLKDAFTDQLKDYPVKVRGFGMMLGIELPIPCGELVNIAREKAHLLINVTGDNVIRLLPALNMPEKEAAQVVDLLVPLIKDFLDSN